MTERIAWLLVAFGLLLALAGCKALLPALVKAAQGAQYLGTVIDVADAGAKAYLARHPDQDRADQIETAVRRARLALSALDRTLAAGEAASREDGAMAKADAVAAYAELRALLDDLGVLSATPPAGGAETDAPPPEPIALPPPVEVASMIGAL